MSRSRCTRNEGSPYDVPATEVLGEEEVAEEVAALQASLPGPSVPLLKENRLTRSGLGLGDSRGGFVTEFFLAASSKIPENKLKELILKLAFEKLNC